MALASLAGVKIEEVQTAIDSSRPELLALACAGIGIDRSVFPTLLSLVRALNDARPSATPDSLKSINTAFTQKSGADAIATFRSEVASI